jgi:hypothetical protein
MIWACLLFPAVAAQASLIAGVATCDGIAMAADSRLNRVTAAGDHQIVSDAFIKLVIVRDRFLVGLGGKSHLGGKPVWRLVEEIGSDFPKRQEMDEFTGRLSSKLCDIYRKEVPADSNESDITILLAGYQDGVGRIVEIKVPTGKITPFKTTEAPGMAWCGDLAITNRLILGVDPRIKGDERWTDEERAALGQREFVFPANTFSLADGVELAKLTVHTSIEWSRYITGTLAEPELYHPTIGGPIDCAVVTPEGARWIERKATHVEPAQ